MNSYFLVVLALLTIMAIAFLMQPLWVRKRTGQDESRVPYFVIALLVPVLGIVIYANIGNPRLAFAGIQPPQVSGSLSTSVRRSTQQSNVDSVASLIDGLAERLANNPQDAGGWLLLAKSHKHLGNRDQAATAYARAIALGRQDPGLDTYVGSDRPAEVAFEGIHGRVTIDTDMAADVDASATVFVIARDASGSPAPLAVLRTTVATLPFDFQLHDGQAMIAGKNLSSADTVVVTAKVSADGDALNTVPGFEIHSDPVKTASPDFVSLHLGQ